MALLIDAGNSAVKWATSDSNSLSKMNCQQYPENITVAFFLENWKDLEKPNSIFVSCVAKESVWQKLQQACSELWEVSVLRVNSVNNGFGLANAYENASALGSDRWCAMIAGLQITKSGFLIVDAGSALTIDRVDDRGQHIGGYILPGLSMMKKSLGIETAQVKVDSFQNNKPSLSLGRSTTDCVESGIYLSAVKLIEAVYEKEVMQTKDLQCYLTGGDAKLLASFLSFECVIMPDIVLQGLAYIAKTESFNKESLFK